MPRINLVETLVDEGVNSFKCDACTKTFFYVDLESKNDEEPPAYCPNCGLKSDE